MGMGLAGLFIGTTLAMAQDPLRLPTVEPPPDPPELQHLRQQTMVQAISAASVLTDQYIKALASLENEAAAKGEYEQALAAQTRRRNLNEVQAQSVLANIIILRPADARLTGSANYDSDKNVLTSLKTVGSTASWDIPRLTPGAYQVSLTYSVAPIGDTPLRFTQSYNYATGGSFEFFEDSSLSGASQNRRIMSVASTGSWDDFVSVPLDPPLQMTRTSARLTLRITRALGDGGVLQIKDIRLVPVVPETTLTLDTPSDPLRTLRSSHQEKLKLLAAPLVSDYLTTLQTRLAGATTASATDDAAEWQEEVNRAAKWTENPPVSVKGRLAGHLMHETDEEWKDVTFIEDVSNTGDRFLVMYQGAQIRVRLSTVTCPPASTEAAGELQYYAAYFRISQEDALMVGKNARDFTLNALRDQRLRLLTHGQKDREGYLLVTVFVPHLGDLAGMLVDNGLAAINPPQKPRRNQPQPPRDAVYSALELRQQQARERSIPPGAWALSNGDENRKTPES